MGKETKQKKRRLRIDEITQENDIRYRGPLSYQHFQIFGWICIVVSQVVVVMKIGAQYDAQFAADTKGTLDVLNVIAQLSLPFLLIANFAQILDDSDGYRKQLIKNIGASAAICGLFYLLFYRYVSGGFRAIITDPDEALPALQAAIEGAAPYGFLCFNLFIDLLLCTLVMLFMNYKPVHLFRGRWVILFRLFTLLPIGYEIGCMLMKVRAAEEGISIPVWMYPLLPVKPPMTFVLFVALAIFVKTRERRFRRHGKTHEEYKAFLKTRRNSWNFSVFLAIMMVIVSLIDFLVILGFSLKQGISQVIVHQSQIVTVTEGENPEAAEPLETVEIAETAKPLETAEIAKTAEPVGTVETVKTAAPALAENEAQEALKDYFESEEMIRALIHGILISEAVGFGGSVYLAYLAPFVLLFSYTRTPKNKMISMLVPVAGIVAIVFVYLEAILAALPTLQFKKLNLQEIRELTDTMKTMMTEQ